MLRIILMRLGQSVVVLIPVLIDGHGRQHRMRADVIVHCQPNLLQIVGALRRRAASRAACTAGNSRAINTAMMAITTSSSISVNP